MPKAELPDVADFALFLAGRTGVTDVVVFGELAPPGQTTAGPVGEVRLTMRTNGSRPDTTGWTSKLPVLVDPLQADKPSTVISDFATMMNRAPIGLVVERNSTHGKLQRLLQAHGIRLSFKGKTRDHRANSSTRNASIFVCENPNRPLSPVHLRAPKDFVVIAFMIVYNESDIMEVSLDDLNAQGVEAYVIDNWSTDGSYEMARERVGQGVTGVERSPVDGPPQYFDLKALLTRVEDLTEELDADWYIKHDADEIRRGPWPGLTLRDSIWVADSAGYNCLDFTVLNFRPVSDDYEDGADLEEHFDWFEFGKNPGHFRQWKAWKDFGQEIDYARFGSHTISFSGLRIFPYKFLLRHYPIRSQRHGEKKVFSERQSRFLPEARERGWHKQYDHMRPGHSFIDSPDDLIEFKASFTEDFLVERLSGAGLERISF